jgi:GGDEF domain-containing protein
MEGQEAIDIEVYVEVITDDGAFGEGFHAYVRKTQSVFVDNVNFVAAFPNWMDLDGEYNPSCFDPLGITSAGYFEADLARQASAHQHANRPFSVIAFRLEGLNGLSPPDAARAFGEAASLALRLVRAEDLAGRIGEDTFAILLPNTDALAADIASRRISAVAECTAFAASPAGAGVQLVSAIACLAPGEGGAGLLARTLDGLAPLQRRAQP